ncbi:hypothetical protein A3C67_00040 [Candidatus Nomurabacteria bacterium RIFCSPHIGHO2_02_FULL_42_19]|uniref:Uncharacterized protein n=1 Tax=Candidatus Nomurabacteria bacterium RIFCSPHIGHO2_02_FULL_42_19 TaxID=1801756 RepID=A0A1F6W3I7_9BACT|nr:MAG: hypothetical protein A3C67_00040 [Candidatus Nomurabacteria bacterium RIFCSPHIGHO2_02_FULL_42_19]
MQGNYFQSSSDYDEWRKTIPYTDEDIAVALESFAKEHPSRVLQASYKLYAEQVRGGKLMPRHYHVALDVLIKTCALCGRKALYRYGDSGRCSEHRLVMPKDYKLEQKMVDRKNALFGQEKLRREKGDFQRRAHHKARGQRH